MACASASGPAPTAGDRRPPPTPGGPGDRHGSDPQRWAGLVPRQATPMPRDLGFEEGWIAAGFEPDPFLVSTGSQVAGSLTVVGLAGTGDAEHGPVTIEAEGDYAIRWVAADPERQRLHLRGLARHRQRRPGARRSARRSATTSFRARCSRTPSTPSASAASSSSRSPRTAPGPSPSSPSRKPPRSPPPSG